MPWRRCRSAGALALLRRPGFRRVYLAVVTSELGDSFQYIALMWAALLAGGPLGVIAVRLADSLPALVFGFHGGLLADRRGAERLMVAADLVRAAALVPVAIAGLTGSLPLWSLVVVAFVLTTCASYFDPAYGAVLPALAGRDGVQAANALVRSSADALWLAGSAVAAALVERRPVERVLRRQRRLVPALRAAALRPAELRRPGARRRDEAAAARGVHGAATAPVACRLDRDAGRSRDDLGRDLDRRRARARAPRPPRRRGTLLAADRRLRARFDRHRSRAGAPARAAEGTREPVRLARLPARLPAAGVRPFARAGAGRSICRRRRTGRRPTCSRSRQRRPRFPTRISAA